jgi:hypothetical protein
METALLNASSNLTVAAEWKTTLIVLISSSRSSEDIARPVINCH